jgi:large subunit ribosomal protein L25
MAETIEIKASARPRSGKGAARTARREGNVPGVIYGGKSAPETIAIDSNELWKIVLRGRFLATVYDVNVDGKKTRVVPRDLQLDPVKDFPIHVDFQRVTAESRIRVKVPARFINDQASPGIKRGGVLNIVRRDIEVFCPPDRIPEVFEFDLTGLEIGRSIHISAVKMPDGVRPTITGRDFTVATIAGALAKTEDEAAPGTTPAEGAAAAPAGDAKAAPAAGAKAAAPAAGGKAAAPAAGAKAAAPAKPAAGGKK